MSDARLQLALQNAAAQIAAAQSLSAEFQAEMKSVVGDRSRLEKSLSSALDDAKRDSTSQQQEIRTLKQQLAAKESTLATTQMDLRTATQDAASANSALSTLQSKFSTFQTQLKQLEFERETELKKRDREVQRFEKKAEEQSSLVQHQAKRIAELEQQQTHLQSELYRLSQSAASTLTHTHPSSAAPSSAASSSSSSFFNKFKEAAAAQPTGHNPLGLPAPTGVPLVSRKSVIPSKFHGEDGASTVPAKRSFPEIDHDDDGDYDMADAGGDDGNEEEDDDNKSEAEAARRTQAAAVRRVSGAVVSNEIRGDPASLPVNQLKSWLTSLDVDFKQATQPKAYYVDLLYQTLGDELEKVHPRAATKKSKSKK